MTRRRPRRDAAAWLLVALAAAAPAAEAQVVADADFDASVASPAFSGGAGPRLLFDEAHRNVHTAGGRYAVVATLLAADGFRVEPSARPFTEDSLSEGGVLLVATARGAERDEAPAFSGDEIAAVVRWIEAGGALFLIADHAPFGSAAAPLAAALGVAMLDGSVADAEHAAPGLPGPYFLRFARDEGGLGEHPILSGRSPADRVATVVTFGGHALAVDDSAARLLVFGPAATLHSAPGSEDDETRPVGGLAQLVALERGAGRVVVAGEAGMFAAQVIRGEAAERAGVPDPFHFGMTYPECDNKQLLLNAVRWLARAL